MAHSLFKPKRLDAKTGKRKVGRYWHGQYRLEGDEEYTRVSLRTTDKRVARQRLDELVERAERLRAGIIAPKVQTDAAGKPIAEHLTAFIKYQTSRNRSRGYVRKLDQRVSRLIAECGWSLVRDVTAESFIAWREGKSLSAKTLNDYQHAIYALLDWLERTGRIKCNPIAQVGRIEARGEQTFTRRAFTDEEAQRLLAVSENRRPVYLLALHTGIRLGELRALRWEDVDLVRSDIRLRVEATKSKRADVLPISETARGVLEALWETANDSGRVFRKGVPSHHTFASDLKAAGIVREDERGRRVDFHALRTTFITNLARAGVPQRQAMALARHTDPRLTANVYTDTDALPLAEAVAKLPAYDAHGRSHGLVSEGRAVSSAVTPSNAAGATQSLENTVLKGVSVCQTVTRKDTEQKWSRGDSNPRPVRSAPRFSVRSR